jgi:hypothetical protein
MEAGALVLLRERTRGVSTVTAAPETGWRVDVMLNSKWLEVTAQGLGTFVVLDVFERLLPKYWSGLRLVRDGETVASNLDLVGSDADEVMKRIRLQVTA